MIYFGLEYLVNHLVSTKFTIDIAIFCHIALFLTILLQGQ